MTKATRSGNPQRRAQARAEREAEQARKTLDAMVPSFELDGDVYEARCSVAKATSSFRVKRKLAKADDFTATLILLEELFNADALDALDELDTDSPDFARVMREIFEGRDPSDEDDEEAPDPTGTGQESASKTG